MEVRGSDGLINIVRSLDDFRQVCSEPGSIEIDIPGWDGFVLDEHEKRSQIDLMRRMLLKPGVAFPLFLNLWGHWCEKNEILLFADAILSCEGYRARGVWKAEEINPRERTAQVWFERD